MTKINSVDTRKRKPYYKRSREVIAVVYFWNRGDGLTMTEIAYWIGLKPSTHLMKILKSMRSKGMLRSVSLPHRPGVRKYKWSLTEHGRDVAKFHSDPS